MQAQQAGWTVRELHEGETLMLSERVAATVVQAAQEPLNRGNELSMVLEVAYAGRSLLFTGDLGARYEQADAYPDCEVLKVAHHGSRYATTAELLSIVRPRLAVISVDGNLFGHPTQEVLDRLAAVGAEVLRTDLHGAVTVTLEPDGRVAYETMRVPEG